MSHVDVVIVAYGDAELVADRVRETRDHPDVRSVIVVDHGDGESAMRAAEAGAITVHDPTNPGFGAGQNRGAALGDAPFLLLLNPDASLEPGALGAGVDLLAHETDVAAVQGAIRDPDTGRPDRSAGPSPGPVDLWGRALGLRLLLRSTWLVALLRALGVGGANIDRVPTRAVDVATMSATAMLVRREAFERVGGFDDEYFLYGEDLDLCWRLRRVGWRLVALPSPWARHRNGSSSASWPRRELVWWEGTLRFAALRWGTTAFVAGVGAGVVQAARITIGDRECGSAAWHRVVSGPVAVRRSRASDPVRPLPTR